MERGEEKGLDWLVGILRKGHGQSKIPSFTSLGLPSLAKLAPSSFTCVGGESHKAKVFRVVEVCEEPSIAN